MKGRVTIVHFPLNFFKFFLGLQSPVSSPSQTLNKRFALAVDPGKGSCEVSPEFERECVDFFAELVQPLGVPRSLGQIYGLLFASPHPLNFTDIVAKLRISKGSASQGLQLLRSLGAVQTIRSPDGKRERFVPELGLRRLMGGLLREKIEPLMTNAGDRMRRLRECAAGAIDPAGSEFSIQQVAQLETWRRQMRLLLPMLKSVLGSGRS